MTDKLLITGASRFGGKASERLELATFIENKKQFSLYIQALQAFYERNQTDVASYFQIAGIHGRPFVDWNQSPSSLTRGFCVHGTSRFATWHRPYVALFEQEIQGIAMDIAKQYKVDVDEWLEAAGTLRQPYWGWDNQATLTPPDAIISNMTVDIMLAPNAEVFPVTNPFFQYTFPVDTDMAAMTPCPFHHPVPQFTTRNTNSLGQSDVAQLKLVLRGAVGRQIVQLATDLDQQTEWVPFATDLENVHGLVHDVTGGFGEQGIPSGHMGWVPYAAFDPIFWAHHSQVDRLIQIWYRKHQKWEQSTADLNPFWKSQTTYWKSQEVVDPDPVFNYTFPNLPDRANPNASRPSWTAHVSAKKFELRGSYTVFLFLGKVPENPKKWTTDPQFAGVFSVFANDTPEECANCREHADLEVNSYVYLDEVLQKAKLESLEERHVVPYLSAEHNSEKTNLNWAVSTGNGRIYRSDDLVEHFPSLKTVIIQNRIHGGLSRAPISGGPFKTYPDITRGRPGGYRDAQA